MANFERKVRKNINKAKEQEKTKSTLKDQIFTFTKILCGILIAVIIICVINNISNGNYKIAEKEVPEIDQYQITSGQTFTRTEEEYYVVFYEEEDVETKINSLNDNSVIYKVDLTSPINNGIKADNSNIVNDIEKLKVKETTLIKVSNHEIVLIKEGHDSVVNYLNSL